MLTHSLKTLQRTALAATLLMAAAGSMATSQAATIWGIEPHVATQTSTTPAAHNDTGHVATIWGVTQSAPHVAPDHAFVASRDGGN